MSPISKKTGRRYARGSHMVRGGYPQKCAGCGKFVPLNNCWQESVRGELLSWHHKCRLDWSSLPAADDPAREWWHVACEEKS